jgi:hypothetical protein
MIIFEKQKIQSYYHDVVMMQDKQTDKTRRDKKLCETKRNTNYVSLKTS